MRIDDHLAAYDFVETHTLTIAAPPDVVDERLHALDMTSSRIVRVLFALRGLPRECGTFAHIERMGFRRLAHDPGRELVLGLIGRFWKINGDIRPFVPHEFRTFAEPGYAQAAWNFTFTPVADGTTRVTTETRIRCTDEASRRSFARYWRVIRPFSGWIRMEMLRALKRSCESRGLA